MSGFLFFSVFATDYIFPVGTNLDAVSFSPRNFSSQRLIIPLSEEEYASISTHEVAPQPFRGRFNYIFKKPRAVHFGIEDVYKRKDQIFSEVMLNIKSCSLNFLSHTFRYLARAPLDLNNEGFRSFARLALTRFFEVYASEKVLNTVNFLKYFSACGFLVGDDYLTPVVSLVGRELQKNYCSLSLVTFISTLANMAASRHFFSDLDALIRRSDISLESVKESERLNFSEMISSYLMANQVWYEDELPLFHPRVKTSAAVFLRQAKKAEQIEQRKDQSRMQKEYVKLLHAELKIGESEVEYFVPETGCTVDVMYNDIGSGKGASLYECDGPLHYWAISEKPNKLTLVLTTKDYIKSAFLTQIGYRVIRVPYVYIPSEDTRSHSCKDHQSSDECTLVCMNREFSL